MVGFGESYTGVERSSESQSGFQTSIGCSLDSLFKPRCVAVVGATNRKCAVGKTIVENLKRSKECCKIASFEIFPVNLTLRECCGLPCYPSVESCPISPDLVVISVPAQVVEEVLESCGRAKVRVVVIISAGFKELGKEGLEQELSLISCARKHSIRVLGPNCLGVMSPHYGLNASFAGMDALPGSVAFMSQSGAMCTAVLGWSRKEFVGFSAFVSIGSMADVDWGDLIDYFAHDSKTKLMVIYMETIGNASHFISAARSIVEKKPIVVIKAGQTEAAAKAAASHTGSLVGSHDAFLAAIKAAGAMVVNSIAEMLEVVLLLAKQPQPRGNDLLVITNAGGPGVLAADAATLHGCNMVKLKDETVKELSTFLPQAWSHANPVDLLGDASPNLYFKSLELLVELSDVNGILLILTLQSVTKPLETANKVIEIYQRKFGSNSGKVLMCSWMGGEEVMEGFCALSRNGIPTFSFPDSAARAFAKLVTQTRHLKSLDEYVPLEPSFIEWEPCLFLERKKKAINLLRNISRETLTEAESKEILNTYGILTTESLVCGSVEEAVEAGNERVGYPCVVKLHSTTITHKSDAGGVILNINSADEVRAAWNRIRESAENLKKGSFQGVTVQPMVKISEGTELILGSYTDSQFGPLVMFGAGGCLVEIWKDQASSLAPLNPREARHLVQSTKISKALKPIQPCNSANTRYRGTDLNSLYSLLCVFSQMIVDLSEFVLECDINPLLALPNKLIVLDARFILQVGQHKAAESVAIINAVPSMRPIVPYPYSLIKVYEDGTVIRPMCHGEANRLLRFHSSINKNCPVSEPGPEIMKLLYCDYSRVLPIVCVKEGEICALLTIERVYPWDLQLKMGKLRSLKNLVSLEEETRILDYGKALLVRNSLV